MLIISPFAATLVAIFIDIAIFRHAATDFTSMFSYIAFHDYYFFYYYIISLSFYDTLID